MINIGIRAHDLGKSSVDELGKKASALGFAHTQLALQKAIINMEDDRGKLNPGMGNHFRDCLGLQGINISVLGCYINPTHPDSHSREQALCRFEEHLRFARSFGCSVVGTETGSPLPDCSFTDEIYGETAFQDFIQSLRRLVAAAEKTGTIVAIEGVADKNIIHSHERMLRTLYLIPSPNLGIIYDPVNFLPAERYAESDRLMEEAFDLFASKMVAVHAKDFCMVNGKKDGTLSSGQGELNYPLLFDLVKKYKPWIPLILENNTLETIEGSMNFIKSLIGS